MGALVLFGFSGVYQFQGGTVHLNHRFHSTFTLGFTQPDPSRQEMNNYAYAACDPINNTDPSGLSFCSTMWAVGVTAGAVAAVAFAPVTGALLVGAGMSAVTAGTLTAGVGMTATSVASAAAIPSFLCGAHAFYKDL
ncbi:RHS repeat-associated core domain-containing protein [Nocardiopsis sp. RV163]|uniref:RHS repeat-associated core domain-containing protein n=1 Tax=Nocardiopsis sp. RV163 TaxID=1661388 RepID=UPI00064BC63B|nr:RHS repeat-associated core domain-containing protein [Nocardiopsis sp. RV163]